MRRIFCGPNKAGTIPDEQVTNRRNCGGFFLFFLPFFFLWRRRTRRIFIHYIIFRDGKFGLLYSYGKKKICYGNLLSGNLTRRENF